MLLLYKNIGFVISLDKKVQFNVPVPFIFRSIIGFQLRKMCCIARNNMCTACMFNATCIYGFTFESIAPKNNPALAGRDRISHPIIICSDCFAGASLNHLILNIIFLGAAIPYIPYFFYALKKGGEAGILKERVPYEVCDIIEFHGTKKGKSLKIDDQQINTQIDSDKWEYNVEKIGQTENKFSVILASPLRYKAKGLFAHEINETEFTQCLHRRAQTLCSQYGYNDYTGEYVYSGNWTVTERNLKWKNYQHYSARQRNEMLLGGLVGNFVLSGKFTYYEYGLLRFAELFHAGKNTNFGLGKMMVNENGGL